MKRVYLGLAIVSLLLTGYMSNNTLLRANKKKTAKNNELQKPVIFAQGVISTAGDEFGATFTPDGRTCYFTVKSPSTISSNIVVICFSKFKDGQWDEPEIAPFSGKYKDFNPSISPDGAKLFFISNRPVDGRKHAGTDIWVVERLSDGWSEPKNLGSPVNTDGYELACSVASDGTLYFSSTGTNNNIDIYCAKLADGKYQTPERLDTTINTAYEENHPFIAPDQSYILFSSLGRPDALSEAGASTSYPRSDLYISYRRDGKWTPAKSLGPIINSTADESCPFLSRDGKTLYFSSERNFVTIPMKKRLDYVSLEDNLHQAGNGLGDIYEIPADVLNKYAQP